MLVVFHGFTETDESWREALGDNLGPLRCALMPGHGWKPCPPDATAASTAQDLLSTLPPEPCDLLGYSLGGRLALALALDFPERVRRLILVGTKPGIEDAAERELRRQHDERLAEILTEDGIGPFVAWWESQPALKPCKPFPRALVEHIRSRRLNQDPIGLATSLRRFGQGTMVSMWSRLGELRMPVTLIAGASDPKYVETAQRMQSMIPQSKLALIPEAGHAVHREARAALIAELARHLGGTKS